MGLLVGLLVLAVLIVVHEWGHFIIAKRLGIPVPVFSVGFGPAFWKRTYNGTEYRLCYLLLGGYVMLEGVDQPGEVPPWRRILIYLGGPLANFVLAFLLFAALGKPELFGESLVRMADLLQKLFTGAVSADRLAGPLGIMQMAGDSAAAGIGKLCGFAAFLSLNLAVLNLLPIPVLDGGQIVLASVEAVIRRPLNVRVREGLFLVAWAFLLGLVIYVTIWGDIRRLTEEKTANKCSPAAVLVDRA